MRWRPAAGLKSSKSSTAGQVRIALHGTDNLAGTLGTAASHGCIRLSTPAITWLARRIGAGVPVTVYAMTEQRGDTALEALARESIDHLTGALGRRAGRAAIQREMARATRFGETLVLIFVDVDGLKATNDDRGHLAGDSVLRATARCLTEGLRAYDVVMRFGGDEFVCTLSDQDADGA